jgi:hypothetical protein
MPSSMCPKVPPNVQVKIGSKRKKIKTKAIIFALTVTFSKSEKI